MAAPITRLPPIRKPSPRRRWGRWLLTGVCLLAVVAGGGIWFRWSRGSGLRERGLQAAREGDSVRAVQWLGQTLRPQTEDAEYWAEYARLREQVLSPEQKQLTQALEAWRQAVDLDPTRATYWRSYARLAAATGDWETTIKAGKKAWDLDSNETEAAHLWVSGLLATRQIEEAARVLEQALERHPDDWRLLTDWILCERSAGRSDMDRLQPLHDRVGNATGDPRWQGVLALETRVTRGREAAVESFQKAAESAPADADYLRWLIPGLDEAGLGDRVIPLLDQHPAALADRRLELVFARRCWETGRPDLILKRLEHRRLNLAVDPELAALQTLAIRAVDGDQTAREQIDRLCSTEQPTPGEILWRLALKSVVFSETCDPAEGVGALEGALRVTGAAPIVHYALAELWFRLGEYRLAAQAASRCSRYAPVWLGPRSLETAAFIRAGLPDDAYNAAFRAFSLEPGSPDAALAFATAWLMVAEPGNDDRPGSLVRLERWLHTLREQVPADRVDAVVLLQVQVQLRLGNKAGAEGLIQTLEESRTSLLAGGAEIEGLRRELQRLGSSSSNDQPTSGPSQTESDQRDDLTRPGITSRAAAPVKSAIQWRLVRARELLANDRSEKGAAEVATLIRPVFDQLPRHPDAHLLAGLAFARMHDRPRAAEHFLQAVDGDWRRASDALWLSLRCRDEGLWDDATELVRLWGSATRHSEKLAAGRRFRGGPAGDDSSRNEATPDARESVILRLLVLAELAEKRQDVELAEAAYRELLALDPDEHSALNNLAMLLLDRPAQHGEALRLVNRALALSPANADYLDTLKRLEQEMQGEAMAATSQTPVRTRESETSK